MDVAMSKLPYKKKSIPPTLRHQVWFHYIGDKIIGNCFCCGEEIERIKSDWHCVKAEARGGTLDMVNLRPICQHCNLSMQTNHMLGWMFEKGYVEPMDYALS